jgi:hypothetical protein
VAARVGLPVPDQPAVVPADSAAAVLGGIRVLAAERDWAPVSAFLDALAPLGDRAILIAAAPGLDPAPLAAWLSAVDWRAHCHLASLTQLAEDPGPGLAANRVVLALKCGDLLMPSSVAGASTVLARPSCSYVVLLVGVEVIDTPADLAVVERAIWQALLGPDGEDWASQDLSAYGCLMWADPADPVDGDLADPAAQADGDAAVPGFLAERVARDRALALDWLLAEVRLLPPLQRARAVHALDLARGQPGAGAAARLAELGALLAT